MNLQIEPGTVIRIQTRPENLVYVIRYKYIDSKLIYYVKEMLYIEEKGSKIYCRERELPKKTQK